MSKCNGMHFALFDKQASMVKGSTRLNDVQSADGNRPIPVSRFLSADSRRGDSIGGQMLNMFNTESQSTPGRIRKKLTKFSYQT